MLARINAFDPKTDMVSPIEAENLRKVHEAGIPVVLGTDAGNPGTLHGVSVFDELEAMQNAGIPAKDLIVMATQNGAMAMRRGEDTGSIEVGKLANLIVLENDPAADITHMRTLSHVMNKGRLYTVKDLAAEKN
jgi:imidazolonepropionase-like amidohydrolase